MQLDDDLLNDLDSDSEVEEFEQELLTNTKDNDDDVPNQDGDGDINLINENKTLESNPTDFNDLSNIQDITQYSKLSLKLEPILEKIEYYIPRLVSKDKESQFLIEVNDTTLELNNEISIIHDFLKLKYKKRFPELESLIPNSLEYAKLIKILGNTLDVNGDELTFLSKEKILVLTMSTIQAKSSESNLSQNELIQLNKASDLLITLEESKSKLSNYVSKRLIVLAPNLTSIVGSSTAAQFFNTLGGIEGLAKTPSCNIAAIGSKNIVGLGFGRSGTVNEGFLYFSDIVQSAPKDLRKQAMRITAGKVILAARLDYSNSVPDGSQGIKWRREIETKIEKLEEPPEIVKTKALPIPIDKPAKKRGGRRYRKMKQRFELSELRKAQNIMEFGKKENTITDSFGEEIGLGITGSLSKIPININNKAKISKDMKNRLEKSKVNNNQDIFNQDFINLPTPKGQ
ncbi:hypothetical protein WICMUC_002934 [Wickerhamomyces mucosus]|uniref:Nop domain-containing protein n=1 Tax=Wickerhamomyces mucosus TaxID=1378264 RepID=A0A9P8PP73_9ASCO|nr:hypothetical protein WICMUC_002934 [Wickerhamomyces mucosus]